MLRNLAKDDSVIEIESRFKGLMAKSIFTLLPNDWQKQFDSLIDNLNINYYQTDTLNKEEKVSRQIPKHVLLKFLNTTLDTQVSDKVLVDIRFLDKGNEIIFSGRPPVLGSATKQMRHSTPYSFVENMIENRVKDAISARSLLVSLKDSIAILFCNEQGAAFVATECAISDIEMIYSNKIKTINKEKKEETVYYLVNGQNFLELESKYKTEESITLYRKQKLKLIKTAFQYLYNEIEDLNTATIACQEIARYILTLTNSKPYTSFPTQGHTLNYSIKLYKYEKNALACSDDYKIINSDEVKRRFDKKEDLNKKIRIVSNEGATVKVTAEALEVLNQIFGQIVIDADIEADLIKEYNHKYNSKITPISSNPVNKLLKTYDTALRKGKSLIDACIYHVAKQLYLAFDFKPLEKFVFVDTKEYHEDEKKAENCITVYVGAKGKKTAEFIITSGKKYRAESIEKAITEKLYNSSVVFRTEERDTQILIEKVLWHVSLTIAIYKNFSLKTVDKDIANEIFQTFTTLIAIEYGMNKKATEEFVSYTIEQANKLNILCSVELASSDSEVDIKNSSILLPTILDKSEVNLVDLLAETPEIKHPE